MRYTQRHWRQRTFLLCPHLLVQPIFRATFSSLSTCNLLVLNVVSCRYLVVALHTPIALSHFNVNKQAWALLELIHPKCVLHHSCYLAFALRAALILRCCRYNTADDADTLAIAHLLYTPSELHHYHPLTIAHSPTQALSEPCTHSLTHPLAHPLIHPLTHPLTHPRIYSLTYPLTHSPTKGLQPPAHTLMLTF